MSVLGTQRTPYAPEELDMINLAANQYAAQQAPQQAQQTQGAQNVAAMFDAYDKTGQATQPTPDNAPTNLDMPQQDALQTAIGKYEQAQSNAARRISGLDAQASAIMGNTRNLANESHANQAKAIEQQIVGEQKLIDVARDAGILEAEKLRARDTHLEVEQMKQQAEQEGLQQEASKRFDALRSGREERAKMGLNPNRIYETEDGKTKWSAHLVGGIARILGGLGGALSGNAQAGVDMVNKQIDDVIQRDMSAQMQDIGQKDKEVDDLKESYGEGLAGIKDSKINYLARKGEIIESYAREIESMKASFKEPEAIARADMALGKFNSMQAENDAQLSNRLLDIGQRELAFKQANANALGGLELDRAKVGLDAAAKSVGDDVRIPGMMPTGEKKITKEDADMVTDKRAEMQKALSKLDAIERHVFGKDASGRTSEDMGESGDYGFESTGRTDAAKAGARMANDFKLMIKGKTFYDMGVLAGKDDELMEKTWNTDVHRWGQGDVKQQIDFWRNKLVSDWETYSRNKGLADKEIRSGQSLAGGFLKPGAAE